MFSSMRTVLFLTYSAIILIVFSVFVLFYYTWSTKQLRDTANSTLERMGSSIQEQIDSQINQLNTLSLNVMYSNLIKDRFQSYLATSGSADKSAPSHPSPVHAPPAPEDVEPDLAELLEQQRIALNNDAKALSEALVAIIGPSRLAEQIYLYSLDGLYYGSGFDTRVQTYTLEENPYIKPLLEEPSRRIISKPKVDLQLSKYYSSDEGKYSLSLYRPLFDAYNVPIGVIEIKQYAYRVFESAASFAENNLYNGQVYVLNEHGEQLYPYVDNVYQQRDLPIPLLTKERSTPSYSMPVIDPITQEKQLLSLHHSPATGWYTALIVSEHDLFAPLQRFTMQLAITALLLLGLGIGLSFYAADKITLPIFRIKRAIRNFSFEHIGSSVIAQRQMNSGITELNELHHTVQHMSERLKQSLDDLLRSETQRHQSQLSALQSQMNPHFLYNMLANLQEMAEQEMNEQLIETIEHMSDFLRYITSKEEQVPLRDELAHTLNYLRISQLRFGKRLSFHVSVPSELQNLLIPKLLIQPLVENSIKFAATGQPPWQINITGTLHQDQWQIEVSDNGPGFNPGVLEALHQRISALSDTETMPELSLNGMGLLNIYMRLQLMYGNNKRFALTNRPTGGASIVVGGPFTHKGVNDYE